MKRFEIKNGKLEMEIDGVTKTMPARRSTAQQIPDIARPHLDEQSRALVDQFVKAGLGPTRIITRGVEEE